MCRLSHEKLFEEKRRITYLDFYFSTIDALLGGRTGFRQKSIARSSFLHYADWILDNEQPFLSKPERLVYPNKTWVAQEIRKANVLCLAYKYTGGMDKNYLDKAQFFYDYIVEQLENHPEQTYTRIMVILLQNHGPHDFFKEKQNLQKFKTVSKIEYNEVPQRTLGSLVKLFFLELLRGVAGFSLTKEITWLNNRL